jgi:hypothetical protein
VVAAGLAMLVLAVAAVLMVVLFPGKDSSVSDHDSDTAYP